jgi:prefoldin subunit 5
MFDIHIHIHQNPKEIMASIQELSAKVDELQVSLDQEQAAIAAAIDSLNQTIVDLQEQLAAGATPEAIQAVIDKVVAVKADLEGTVGDTEVAPV